MFSPGACFCDGVVQKAIESRVGTTVGQWAAVQKREPVRRTGPTHAASYVSTHASEAQQADQQVAKAILVSVRMEACNRTVIGGLRAKAYSGSCPWQMLNSNAVAALPSRSRELLEVDYLCKRGEGLRVLAMLGTSECWSKRRVNDCRDSCVSGGDETVPKLQGSGRRSSISITTTFTANHHK